MIFQILSSLLIFDIARATAPCEMSGVAASRMGLLQPVFAATGMVTTDGLLLSVGTEVVEAGMAALIVERLDLRIILRMGGQAAAMGKGCESLVTLYELVGATGLISSCLLTRFGLEMSGDAARLEFLVASLTPAVCVAVFRVARFLFFLLLALA